MTNYVLIGDIHSQYNNFNRALDWIDRHVNDYHIIQLGDVFDSRNDHSDSIEVFRTIQELGDRITVIQSNHQWKLYRYFLGNKVTLDGSILKTISDFENSSFSNEQLFSWLGSLAFAITFKDENNLEYRVAHAYFNNKLYVPTEYEGIYSIHEVSRKTRDNCLYGILRKADNQNERILWWQNDAKHDFVRVAGHYHTIFYSQLNNTLILDGGCGEYNGTLPIFVVNSQTLLTF